jgi:hypothetical protein
VEEAEFRLVLTALKAGARVRQHRTKAWVSIEMIAGHLRIHVPGQVVDVPHELEALDESAFLLTLAPVAS